MLYKTLHNVMRHWFGPCSQKWIIQGVLNRNDGTWSSALLSCFLVWQTRCLKSADFPSFSDSSMIIIFFLINLLCIWVSIFHMFCCSSSLLFAHPLKLPAEVWQGNKGVILWDLNIGAELLFASSKMLLYHTKFQSLAEKTFQDWNTGFDLYPCQILFWNWCFLPSFL